MPNYPGMFEEDEDELAPVDSIAGPQTPRGKVMERIAQVRGGSGEDEQGEDPDMEFAKQSAMTANMGRGLNALAAGTGFRADNSGYDAMEKRGADALSRGASVRKAIADRQMKDRAFALAEGRASETARHNRVMEGRGGMMADGKRLPADKVLLVNEGNEMPKLMSKIEETIGSNGDIFGPVQGRISGLNPYDDRGQAIQSQMKTAAQLVGKYMEGGVLRKEDEAKYEQMLPSLSDTPETAKNKLAIIRNMLASKQKSNLEALQASGYDASGIQGDGAGVPDLPSALTAGAPRSSRDGGFAKTAIAGGSGRVTVTNGKERFSIELKDLPDAMADGFQVMK